MTADFLANELRRVDPDRHLLSLFVKRSARPAVQALVLFLHELTKIRSSVSDTTLGHIRLQWWRDEIGKLYAGGDGGQTPILSTLAPLIHAQVFPQALFDDLLYAREFDLEDVAPASVDGLRKYAEFTTVPLNRLALLAIGEEASDEELRVISTNYGLVEVLRRVPLDLSQRRCLLPEDLLREKNITPAKIIDFDEKQVVIDVSSSVFESIDTCQKSQSRFLRKQQSVSNIYLKYIKKIDFDVFSPRAAVPPPFLALKVALS